MAFLILLTMLCSYTCIEKRKWFPFIDTKDLIIPNRSPKNTMKKQTFLHFLTVCQEKSRNFGPSDPFFHEEIAL